MLGPLHGTIPARRHWLTACNAAVAALRHQCVVCGVHPAGMIPPELGLLSFVERLKVTNTSMSCAGIIKPFSVLTSPNCGELERCTKPIPYGDDQAQYHVCSESELLPCFLRFSEYQIPRDDHSNMRCRYILRKEQQQAIEDCSGVLGDQASMLPNSSEAGATWLVDPSYYQFRECSCLVVRVTTHGSRAVAGSVLQIVCYVLRNVLELLSIEPFKICICSSQCGPSPNMLPPSLVSYMLYVSCFWSLAEGFERFADRPAGCVCKCLIAAFLLYVAGLCLPCAGLQ